jgi:hypothetical protein
MKVAGTVVGVAAIGVRTAGMRKRGLRMANEHNRGKQ